ncbi:MAG: 4Fe-4S binding protein, partial [Spirochaetes bacterium]|nr:4Fe-4S binding protein [Spirochaetota bacterium]
MMSLGGTAFGIVAGSLLIFAVQFLSSLFVGRLFCGWACPVGGLQEAVDLLRGKPVNRRRISWIKWLVWAPWVASLAFFALRAGGFTRVEVFYQTWHGISVADLPSLIAYAAVVALFLVLSLTVGRRAGCHAVCWMAPFMVIGRKIRNVFAWPSLRLGAEMERCTRCGTCSAQCPMSIEVRELVEKRDLETSDCILRGTCVDVCPRGVIRNSFSAGSDTRAQVTALMILSMTPIARSAPKTRKVCRVNFSGRKV